MNCLSEKPRSTSQNLLKNKPRTHYSMFNIHGNHIWMLHSILVWYSAFQLVVSIPTVLGEDIRELSFFNNSVFKSWLYY
jgi:hypothetical protein